MNSGKYWRILNPGPISTRYQLKSCKSRLWFPMLCFYDAWPLIVDTEASPPILRLDHHSQNWTAYLTGDCAWKS